MKKLSIILCILLLTICGCSKVNDDPIIEDNKEPVKEEVPTNKTLVKLDVDMKSTYGNSIFPKSIVDIYIQTKNSLGLVDLTPLYKDIYVESVKDSEGKDVFENTLESRIPSYIEFYLPDHLVTEYNQMLESDNVYFMIVPKSSSQYDGNILDDLNSVG